jgi:chorismate synthase
MLRYLTAGESHGKGLTTIVEGMPSNVFISLEEINKDMKRRQMGYGRGGRMKIETDEVEVISGIRSGLTLGSPITLYIKNLDYENWEQYMDPQTADVQTKKVTKPRPGHADLSGSIKYKFDDVRNVLERSSARETASRVAAGSIAKQFLKNFNINVYSHVISIGTISVTRRGYLVEDLRKADDSDVRCIEKEVSKLMCEEIDAAKLEGDSLGGAFEVVITGVPVGLGSYVQWDRKVDAKLAYALMSIQAIKGVEFGLGFESAELRGSMVHDEIFYKDNEYVRETNRAGGVEGGMTNGSDIVIRCAMKPIPTLYKPLKSVDMSTKKQFEATVERSDCCAVPAASVVAEAVAALVLAGEILLKYGGDSMEELIERWQK